ncbi:MAG TPA: LysR family transcriptional regulator [Acetobacteraceae bacterium]|nr:LysR family transcriptional regulator [Acetobacteraceae bacterium]
MDLLRALGTFVRVVETGSFSAVAREAGTSHSAATRLIGQLEAHFGVRLFHRTTRRLSLTEDGQDLVNHARHLIETTQEMEETLGRQRSSPSGLVRIGVPPAVATLIVPRLPVMFQRYPALSVELVVADRFGDLVEERLDLALQRGQPGDTSVVARAIGTFGRVIVAGPAYLEQRGAPRHPSELTQHNCIIHDTGPDSAHWRFTGPDGPVEVLVAGALRADNGEVVHRAALAGYGIAKLPESQVVDDIRAARLYRLLADYPSGREQMFVVYPSRRHLAPRTRVMIDFVVAMGRAEEARLADARVWGENDTAWLV